MNELFFVCVVFFFFSGCFQPTESGTPLNSAEKECINLCESMLKQGMDLSSGPCIGNPLNSNFDFVCDIAHNPRKEIDNLSENQCSFFSEGKAKHFVELDEKCSLIRKV